MHRGRVLWIFEGGNRALLAPMRVAADLCRSFFRKSLVASTLDRGYPVLSASRHSRRAPRDKLVTTPVPCLGDTILSPLFLLLPGPVARSLRSQWKIRVWQRFRPRNQGICLPRRQTSTRSTEISRKRYFFFSIVHRFAYRLCDVSYSHASRESNVRQSAVRNKRRGT